MSNKFKHSCRHSAGGVVYFAGKKDMGKRYEDFRIWLEGVFEDETDVVEQNKTKSDMASATGMKRRYRWLFLYFILSLLMILVIDIALLFTLPVEILESDWIWIKEPVLIIFSFWVCRRVVGMLRRIFPRG